MKNSKTNILYIHGYNGSGTGITANTFRNMLSEEHFNFISPQLSNKFLDVKNNIEEINRLIKEHEIDIVIGNSLGGFEVTAATKEVVKVLINPVFNPITDSMKPEIFEETFHTQEAKEMVEDIISNIKVTDDVRGRVWGFFGAKDDVVSCHKQFSELFDNEKMVILRNAQHQLNSDEIEEVVSLIKKLAEI